MTSSRLEFSFSEFKSLAKVLVSIADGVNESNTIVFGDPCSGDYIEFVGLPDDAPEIIEQKARIDAANADLEYAKSRGISPEQYSLIVVFSNIAGRSVRELIDEYIQSRDSK